MAALALGLACQAAPAAADVGDVAVGPSVAWTAWRGGRVGLLAEVGVADFLAVHGALQAGLSPHPGAAGEGIAALGLTALVDVAHWVPALTVTGGLVGDSSLAPRLEGLAMLRRYVAARTWVGLGFGAEWRPTFVRGEALLAVAWLPE